MYQLYLVLSLTEKKFPELIILVGKSSTSCKVGEGVCVCVCLEREHSPQNLKKSWLSPGLIFFAPTPTCYFPLCYFNVYSTFRDRGTDSSDKEKVEMGVDKVTKISGGLLNFSSLL